MGINVAMLSEGPTAPGLHANGAVTLELEECVHFHVREFRLMWTAKELLKIADTFVEAKETLLSLGGLENSERMYKLAQCFVGGDDVSLQQGRQAVELTEDGTVHVHHKNLRLHMTQADFYEWGSQVETAIKSLAIERVQEVELAQCTWSPAVEEYLAWLQGYKVGSISRDQIGELEYLVRWHEIHPGESNSLESLQRFMGELPRGIPSPIPEELNRKYLFCMYEGFRHWGYAKGPFWGKYMPAYRYPDGRVYLRGAHRTACLRYLGHERAKVFLCAPTSDAPDGAGYQRENLSPRETSGEE